MDPRYCTRRGKLRGNFNSTGTSRQLDALLKEVNPFPGEKPPFTDPDKFLPRFGAYSQGHLVNILDIGRLANHRGEGLLNQTNQEQYNGLIHILHMACRIDLMIATKIVARHLKVSESEALSALTPLTPDIGRVLDTATFRFGTKGTSLRDCIKELSDSCTILQEFTHTITTNQATQNLLKNLPDQGEVLRLREEILPLDSPFEVAARKAFRSLTHLGVSLLTHRIPLVRLLVRMESLTEHEISTGALIVSLRQCLSLTQEGQGIIRGCFARAIFLLLNSDIEQCGFERFNEKRLVQYLTSSHLALAHEAIVEPLAVMARSSPLRQQLFGEMGVGPEVGDLRDLEIACEIITSGNGDLEKKLHAIIRNTDKSQRIETLQFLAARPSLLHSYQEVLRRGVTLGQCYDFFRRLSELEPLGPQVDLQLQTTHANPHNATLNGENLAWLVRNSSLFLKLVEHGSPDLVEHVLELGKYSTDQTTALRGARVFLEQDDLVSLSTFLGRLRENPTINKKAIAELFKQIQGAVSASQTPTSAPVDIAPEAPTNETSTTPDLIAAFRRSLSLSSKAARNAFDSLVSDHADAPIFRSLLESKRLATALRAVLSQQDPSILQRLSQLLTAPPDTDPYEALGRILIANRDDAVSFVDQLRILHDRGIPSELGPIKPEQRVYLIGPYAAEAQQDFTNFLTQRGYDPDLLRIYSPEDVENLRLIPSGSVVLAGIRQSHATFGYVKVRARRSGSTFCSINSSGKKAIHNLLELLFPAQETISPQA